ncbi:MAG TPA: FtsX-like permease family protein [Bacteroidales bacterium]|nr:FtsX-like permease family protein [Bacteroidales bacterium]
MINSLFKHSLRTLNRQKGYFLINITGLSIGIACSLIIALFIIHELSYDQYNEKKDRIFRLVISGIIGEQELNVAITSASVGPTMLREFPEVEDFTRISTPSEPLVEYLGKKYFEKGFIESDSSFFNVFSIPLLRGNKKTVLSEPHTLVISESTAVKLFDKDDPIDKSLLIGNDTVPYRITGLMADIPETSHFTANMIGSFITNPRSRDTYWGNNNYGTYILLKPNTDHEQVNAKMPGMIRKYMGELAQQALGITIDELITRNKYTISLQPIKDIHLNPKITQPANTKPPNNPKYLYIFGSIAVLIIIIAAINFMNLSTAQASKRAKEVGIKKVSGSTKGMLVRQFLAESILLSFAALILAIVVIENSLPYFNNMLGIDLQLNLFGNWFVIPALLGLSVILGLIAGSYPAFFLSAFNPYIVLKGKLRDSMKNGRLRSILVIFQFSISIVLIVGTFIMFRQIKFMLNKDLGFNKEQLLVISHADAIGDQIKVFKDELAKIPEVLKVASSTAVPGRSESGKTYVVEGRVGDIMEFKINYIDYDFFETYGISLTSGRDFNESFTTDNTACIVNETAVKRLNLTNPLATRLVDNFEKLSIVGIVKNFHFESLQNAINPYVFKIKSEGDNYGFFSIRLSTRATSNTIKEVEKVWNVFAGNDPLQFFFMDQDFEQKYKEEKQSAQLSVIFSILAVIIASLGLFGLTSFTIEQRTKEIGIRKTMGASLAGIFYLISKEFIWLVTISALISWPLVYFVAKNWLQNYHYRIDLRPWDFLAGFLIALIIALITISYRTIRSARTNPVEALRYE